MNNCKNDKRMDELMKEEGFKFYSLGTHGYMANVVEALGLPKRTCNILRNNNINMIDDVINADFKDICNIKFFGKKSALQLVKGLYKLRYLDKNEYLAKIEDVNDFYKHAKNKKTNSK